MPHVMLDIETFGVRPWSVVRSIGAVSFDFKTDSFGDEFYVNIDQASCEEAGLACEQKVVDWWKKQSQDAQDAFLVNPLSLTEALTKLTEYYERFSNPYAVHSWSQGAAFDFPILTTAYQFCGLKEPWNFRLVRDTRTAYHMFGFDPDTVAREGIYHSAIDDCKHQIRCLRKAIRNE